MTIPNDGVKHSWGDPPVPVEDTLGLKTVLDLSPHCTFCGQPLQAGGNQPYPEGEQHPMTIPNDGVKHSWGTHQSQWKTLWQKMYFERQRQMGKSRHT